MNAETDMNTENAAAPLPPLAIEIQRLSEAHGAWKWVRNRGRFRVAVVRPGKPHRKRNQPGFVTTLWESGSVAFDYSGGRWGFGAAEAEAKRVAAAESAARGIPVI